MSYTQSLLAGIIGLLSMMPLVHADTSIESDSNSLYSLMVASIEQHPSLQAKISQLKSSEYSVSAAEWARYPTVGLSTRSLSDGTSVVATIEQPIWTGGRINGEINKAINNENLADYDLQDTQFNLLSQVNDAFFSVKSLQYRLTESLNNVKEHRRLLEIIERRVASQISPKADDLFAESRLRSALSESIQLKRQLRKAKNVLVQLTNTPINELSLPSINGLAPYTLPEVIQLSSEFSAYKKRLLSEVSIAQNDITLAKSQAMPTIILGFQSNMGVNEFSSGRDGLYVGVQVSSGAGLSAFDNIKSSTALVNTAQQQVALYEVELRQQVEDNWAEYMTLQDELEFLEFSYDASIEVIESYIRQFRIGKKSWQDVLNAQKEKTQNSYQLSDAKMKLLQMTIRLKLQAGILQLNNLETLK